MQMLKLKRIKKKSDMPCRKTIDSIGFHLNGQWIDVALELDNRIIITNTDNGKIYELINHIDEKYT